MLRLEIRKARKNLVIDHLFGLEFPKCIEPKPVPNDDNFLDEYILVVSHIDSSPWFSNIVNYLSAKVTPPKWSSQQRK